MSREAFEKWSETEAIKSYLTLDLNRGHNDEYTFIDTRISYISYQSGRASMQAENDELKAMVNELLILANRVAYHFGTESYPANRKLALSIVKSEAIRNMTAGGE